MNSGGGGGNDSKDIDGDSRVRSTLSLIFLKGKESPKTGFMESTARLRIQRIMLSIESHMNRSQIFW